MSPYLFLASFGHVIIYSDISYQTFFGKILWHKRISKDHAIFLGALLHSSFYALGLSSLSLNRTSKGSCQYVYILSWRIFLFLLLSWSLVGLLLLLPIKVLYQTFHYSWVLLSQDHSFFYLVYLFVPATLSYSISNQGIFEYVSRCMLIILKPFPRCVG